MAPYGWRTGKDQEQLLPDICCSVVTCTLLGCQADGEALTGMILWALLQSARNEKMRIKSNVNLGALLDAEVSAAQWPYCQLLGILWPTQTSEVAGSVVHRAGEACTQTCLIQGLTRCILQSINLQDFKERRSCPTGDTSSRG